MNEDYSKQADETRETYKRLKQLDPKNPLLGFIKLTREKGFRYVIRNWENFMDKFSERDYETGIEVLERRYKEAMGNEIKRIEKEKGLAKKV